MKYTTFCRGINWDCTASLKKYNKIYLFIKYIKSVLWRVAEPLSYVEDACCLKVKITLLWPIHCRCMFRLSMGIRRGCYVKRCKRIGVCNEDAICFCEVKTEFSKANYVDFVFNIARVRQMIWTMLTAGINGGIYQNCIRLQERKWGNSL